MVVATMWVLGIGLESSAGTVAWFSNYYFSVKRRALHMLGKHLRLGFIFSPFLNLFKILR